MTKSRIQGVCLAVLGVALAVTVGADGGPNHQQPSDQFGTSGGNINDVTRRFCCSGTLGALVSDGSALYVLSNNHVLGRSGKAAAGEDVSQPGLIDNNCRPGTLVADLAAVAPLGPSNVDAAIAQLRTGTMDPSGTIMDIGVPGSTVTTATVGMGVSKSGRTTGRTNGTVGSINTNVSVQYQQSCGSGKKFVVSYTNQIVINSSTFSAGGDSGSLIVTNNAAHNPVGLLFAGSSTTTIANPIGQVLNQLGAALGRPVGFSLSGGSASTGGAGSAEPQAVTSLSDAEVGRGNRAKESHARRLMADPAIFGVGVGEDPEQPGRAAVVIYAQPGRVRAAIARELDGVRTHVIETDPIVAYGWNAALGGGADCRGR
jgi:hypothetical protein